MQLHLQKNLTLLRHITVSLIQDGKQIFYLGDASEILNRSNQKTVLFNPSREDRYVPWNPLKGSPSVLADTFLDTWYEGQKTAGSSYYQSIEHLYLTAAFAVLIENNCNLIHLPYFLTNEKYRLELLDNVKDFFVKDFWCTKVEQKDIASIYAKVYSLLLNPSIRRVFSSKRDTLDADVILADIRLPKTETRLLGSLMMSQTDHMVVVEDCARYSPSVLISLIESGHPVLLHFNYREQLAPDLYDAISARCRRVNATVSRSWGDPVEPFDLEEFWPKHDAEFTRSVEKADRDIDNFLGSLK